MKFTMTLQQFLQNPTGPYSAYFGRRDQIKRDLTQRFTKLLSTNQGKFNMIAYTKRKDYYYQIKVPSETFSNIFYDVVIKLSPSNEASESEYTMLNYKVEVFSNSPAFVFTYAYVFNKDKMLIDFLKPLISKQALKEQPKIKNPVQIYGFEKSIYFALLYIKYKNSHIKLNMNGKTLPLDKKSMMGLMNHSDDILFRYNVEKKKEAEKKKNEKASESKQKKVDNNKKIAAANANRKSLKNKVIKAKKKI